MKINKNLLVTLALALTTTSLFAQDKVIRIGLLVPISGPASYLGLSVKQGVELALDQINKSGVNNYKLQAQFEDSACSPLQATITAKRMLEQYKPHIVIGEVCSDASLAIAPILEQAKVPMLNTGSSAVKLTNSGYKYVFRLFPNADQQSARLAKVAQENLNAKTAVVLFENTNAGVDNATAFERYFTAGGGKVIASIGFGKEVNDFTTIATRVASLGKIDVISMIALEGQGVKLTQALAQAKVSKGGGGPSTLIGPIYLPWGFDQKAGPSSVGYVRAIGFNHNEQRKMVQNFLAAYKAKHGANETPSQFLALAYDGIYLIAEAIKGGATTSEGIREQLSKMKDIELTTSIKATFDQTGQNIDPSAIHYVETNKDLSWKSLPW